jgi:serine/threonine protein phosphatase 1
MAASYADCNKTVVHGHEPVETAVVGSRRINVDTGAYATGRLSAVRLSDGQPPHVLTVTRSTLQRSAGRPSE